MAKTYKSFILLFTVFIMTLLFFLKKYNDILNQNRLDMLVSKRVEFINSELSYQKKHALSLAILFAKNQHIIDYFKSDQRQKLKQELNSLIQLISNNTKEQKIQIQVHTKDLKVFVRTWEDKDTGLSLQDFRHGLVKVKTTKQPHVSNELGKRFNIKAIAPIYDKGNYIGSLEVITDYTPLRRRLHIAGIEVLPLLDSKFLKIAKYHQNNQRLYDFVVIDKNYNKKLFDLLKHNKTILEKKKLYHEIGDRIITLIPIGTRKGMSVGYLAAGFEKVYEDFNYLPKYEYSGDMVNSHRYFRAPVEKREVVIK